MYSKALIGYGKVFGPDHPRSPSLWDSLQNLGTVIWNEALKDIEELVGSSRGHRVLVLKELHQNAISYSKSLAYGRNLCI
jgi:hypothetical protein